MYSEGDKGKGVGSNNGDYYLPRTYRLLYSSKHVDTLKTVRDLVDVGSREGAGTFGVMEIASSCTPGIKAKTGSAAVAHQQPSIFPR